MNCEAASRSITLYFYGELSLEDEERIEDHLDACVQCREEMERYKAVGQALSGRELQPPAGLLAECRHDLMRAVYRDEAAVRRRPETRAWPLFRQGLDTLLAPFARLRAPLGALALIALGFFSARILTRTTDRELVSAPVADPTVISTVRSVQPDASGRVQIAVDETRRRVIFGQLGDPAVQHLLLAAARDESNPGVRVESVDVLKSQPASQEVRGMLLYAVARDPNAGVRLKALEGLKPFAGDPPVRQVLAQVLLKDENPGVRIQAIDILTAKPDGGMVGVLQNLVQKENNGYVRLRIEKALEAMNASVGTF
jgi:hypothetical protein